MRHVLFDLDGTLLDSIPLIVESMRYALSLHFEYAPNDETLVSGIGTPLDEQLKHHGHVHLGRPLTAQELTDSRSSYLMHNRKHHDARTETFPGVLEALNRLKDMSVRMGIVTSKPQATALRGLKLCKIDHFFEFVIGYDDVVNPKPHPEPVLKAASLLSAEPTECLFVGDSPHDILSGRRATSATAAALWGPFNESELRLAEPTYLLNHISEIAPLMARN